jgi:predicted RNA-binding protein (TIGR00451 family)
MFGRPDDAVIASRSLLRGKEAKALRAALAFCFALPDVGALSSLLPDGVDSLKLARKTRAFCAERGDAPIFVDLDSKAPSPYRLLPTLPGALWAPATPIVLPALTVSSPVSSFLIRGADLMLPGVLPPLPCFKKGDLLAVRVRGNPAPFAVGEACVSSEEAAAGGMRGRALKLLHHYGVSLDANHPCAPKNPRPEKTNPNPNLARPKP